jgi:DNA-binding IclR family transcriptional regulator
MSQATGLTSFRKTLQILDLLSNDGDGLTVEQIAEGLGFSTSTTYRYVRSLRQERLVEESSDGSYQLGSRLILLARAARGPTNVIERARPTLEHLVKATGNQVFLSRLTEDLVICVDTVEPAEPRPFRVMLGPGDVVPLNQGAAAKAILAQLPPEKAVTLLLATDLNGPPQFRRSQAEWLSELAEIRERGYAVTEWKLDGVRAIAAPVFAPRKRLAAVSVTGPVGRLTDERVPEVVDHLRQSAGAITERLADM